MYTSSPLRRQAKGFTLIELMIVVAILGVLAAIAIPLYSNYQSRARAAGASTEINSVRSAISACYQELATLDGCTAGSNGVPFPAVSKNITAVTSVEDGVITVTTGATTTDGTRLTIIARPSFSAGAANLLWTNEGTSCEPIRGFKSGAGDCP